MRFVSGSHQPSRARPRCGSGCGARWSLGEEPSPWQRAAAAADFGNGVSAELDFDVERLHQSRPDRLGPPAPGRGVGLPRCPDPLRDPRDRRRRVRRCGTSRAASGARSRAWWWRSDMTDVAHVEQYRTQRRRAPGGPGRGRPSRPPFRGPAVELAPGGGGQCQPGRLDPDGGRSRTPPYRRAPRQRPRVRLLAGCRGPGRRGGRRDQPDPPGRGAGRRHPCAPTARW